MALGYRDRHDDSKTPSAAHPSAGYRLPSGWSSAGLRKPLFFRFGVWYRNKVHGSYQAGWLPMTPPLPGRGDSQTAHTNARAWSILEAEQYVGPAHESSE